MRPTGRKRATGNKCRLLALLTTTTTAAPLFLKCEGKEGLAGGTVEMPALHSIKIDGATVEVDGIPAGKIDDSRAHIWSFGNETDRRIC
jgi:hypothetical protein